MNKRHKHYEIIMAWAEGKDVEFLDQSVGKWYSLTGDSTVCWSLNNEYRIKPKPDVVKEWQTNKYGKFFIVSEPNLRLTFDGETGELKRAEVI